MAGQNKETNEQYRRAREEFDSLKIEEKAIFMVESAFSMLAHGIEAIGNVFSEQVDKMTATEKEKPAQPKASTTTKKTTSRKSSSTRSSSRTKKEPEE